MKEGKVRDKTYIVEIAPLTKGVGRDSLSYFSTSKLTPGTLVKVPVRNTLSPGVVLGSRGVTSAKSDIRKAGFMLRKLPQKNITEASLSSAFISAARETALYYATSLGPIISTLIPKAIIEEAEKFFQTNSKKGDKTLNETIILQMEMEERYGQYRALVRQNFARGASMLFIVPTHSDALKAATLLSQGITPFVYVFTVRKPPEAKDVWKKAQESGHPILFITTPAGVAFDRSDIETIVIERENSRAYRTLNHPYINYKNFIEKLCKHSGKQLVLGDSVLSIETLWREKQSEFGEFSLVRWRLPAAPTLLVDASAKMGEDGKFAVLSKELKGLIKKAIEEKEAVFLFGTRKGLAPTTVCGDCGFILPCLNCGAPVVLHRQSEASVYVCHACGTKRDSHTACGYCGSWKLVPLGIGVEKIAVEVRALFRGTKVEILDKDHAPTDAKARSIVKRFKEEGGILIGTELALFYLEKVPFVGLVSTDSLFSIPDFGINEKIFYLVSKLREITGKESIVQTRNIGKQVLAWATQGNIIDFYSNEISDRKALLYPPFSIFVKITALTPKENMSLLKERFLKWHPDIFKDSIIMRIPRDEWPNPDLNKEISLLGRSFSIKVDPESIL